MSSNGYELGTAQTLDSAVPKYTDLSKHLPDAVHSIDGVVDYEAAGELILIAQRQDDTTDYYRSLNDGREWGVESQEGIDEPFWADGRSWGNSHIETQDGTLIFQTSGNNGTINSYTGGGEQPEAVKTGFNMFQDSFTQTQDGDIYAAEYGGDGTSENFSDIIKSTDDGQTWSTVVNIQNTVGGGHYHLHGMDSQGEDRLFVLTGDAQHSILESNDEFSTWNEWDWNRTDYNDDYSGTGIQYQNNRLIIGTDQIPAAFTHLWVGDQYGDIPTRSGLDNGDLPLARFDVQIPPIMGASVPTADAVWGFGRQDQFPHRIEGDGRILVAVTDRTRQFCVSTDSGHTWHFFPTHFENLAHPSLGRDEVWLAGDSNGRPTLYRVPKDALLALETPERNVYHVLFNEELGDSSSAGTTVPVGRGLPFHKFRDFRFGVNTDGDVDVDLYENGYTGTAPTSLSDSLGNDIAQSRESESITGSGYSTWEWTDLQNGGFDLIVTDQQSSSLSTVGLFVQMQR